MESKTYNKNQLMPIKFTGLNNHILFKCNLLKDPRSFRIKSLITNDVVTIDIQDYVEKNVNEENINEKNVNEENINEKNTVLDLHSNVNLDSESKNESYYNMKSINLKDENNKSIGIQCDIEEMYDYIEWIFL
jgi:hypothetical protein